MMRFTAVAGSVFLFFVTVFVSAAGADDSRPNVVFILSEDNSIHYVGHYGYPPNVTPNLEAMAENGVTFNHAFSCSPVCSVARTTLMTGMLAPRGGFQFHRRIQMATLPGDASMFPAYLKQAGYYTTNNNKQDYNVQVDLKAVWDESSKRASWRQRPTPETPFFHMQTTGISHESSLHFGRDAIDPDDITVSPDDVKVAPYHPDTEIFRFTNARYYDRIQKIDAVVGGLVQQLRDDSVLDNTIIFYFGDHGGVLPRGKGYAYESGLHVPLIVRVPEKWKHLCPFAPGSRANGFVSFIDFGPTALNLAGVDVPSTMDGTPFLGEGVTSDDVETRDTAYGYADRFDEKYDLVRSLRKGKYQYIRSFTPWYPDGLQNNYRYRMLAYEEWRQLYKAGKLNKTQSAFFEPRPVELLFDAEADPHEVRNLSDDPQFRHVLVALRDEMSTRIRSMPDLSLLPESEIITRALPDAATYGRDHFDELTLLADIADLALLDFGDAREAIDQALQSNDPMHRYWAFTVCAAFGQEAGPFRSSAEIAAKDDMHLLVRLRAAEFLAIATGADTRESLYAMLNESESPAEALIMLNTAVFFNDHLVDRAIDASRIRLKVEGQELDRRIDYLSGKIPNVLAAD